jgi:DNA modification methylase
MKPVELIKYCIKNSSRRDDLVLDVFGGSGSTLIAAHDTGRVAALVELDPTYCDVICRRFQEQAGVVPILEASGDEHDFTA